MDSSIILQKAIALAKDGDRAQARKLVSEILHNEPSNADGWVVMAQIVDSQGEAVDCMRKALRIRPDDENARRYLAYLERQKTPARRRIPVYLIAGGLAALALLCAAGLLVSGLVPLSQPTPAQPQISAVTCRELIDQALRVSDESCQTIDQNHVCYGHTTVTASLAPGRAGRFQQTGDVLPVDSLTRLSAAPLDLDTRNWGVSIFKLQANLPYTVPGELVTMIVAGNTSLENSSRSMETFTFSSGIGGINCESAPVDGLVIHMPDGAGIRFQVNGSDLALSGDAILQAQTDDQMQVSMIDGGGWISSDGVEKFFNAGETASVTLDGLVSDSPPSVKPSGGSGDLCLLMGTCGTVEPPQPPGQAVALLATSIKDATLTPTPKATKENAGDPSPTAGEDETASPTSAHTETPGPSPTPSPTRTPKPPTITPLPKNTASAIKVQDTPTPTRTPKPTLTPTPTKTAEPTHTPTPSETPTPSNTPAPTCDNITAGWRRVNNQTAQFKFANQNRVAIKLTEFTISWPSSNGKLIQIGFNGQFTDSEIPGLPDDSLDFSASVSGPHAVLPANSPITDLQFKFEAKPPLETGYLVTATFDVDGGCVKTITH